MIQETMMYSVKTALLGMLIVFSFLALLSLLMWGIKGFFVRLGSAGVKEPSKEMKRQSTKEKKSGNEQLKTEEATTKDSTRELQGWLSATVAVFLILEDEDAEISAENWRPLDSENMQLWIVSGVNER